MDSSGWIALAALAVSIVTLLVNARQNQKTRKDAKRESAEAMAEAKEGRKVAERHAAAAERAAKAAELTAEALRAVVEETRRDNAGDFTGDLVAKPQQASLPLVIEKGRGQTYVLRNVSSGTLQGVTLITKHPEALTRNIPDGETLQPGQGVAFLIAESLQAPLPNDVQVSWEGATQSLGLSLPRH